MSESDVQRAAEFLAAHAVVLLGLGILAALAAFGAVYGAVRILRRHRAEIRCAFKAVVRYARAADIVDRSVSRTRAFIPSGYLAVHLRGLTAWGRSNGRP